MSLELKAKEFATFHHNRIDQRRKYTNEPYIVHPTAVVNILRKIPHTEAMLCAAWLHDVVEDTQVTLDEIAQEFTSEITSLVEMLTDIAVPKDGNRAARMEKNRQHISQASPQGKTIKLADLIDNTKTITLYDPNFAKVYMREKALLLDYLKDGDSTLYTRAHLLVTSFFQEENSLPQQPVRSRGSIT